MAFAPDGRMFITLKGGVVRVYQNGALLPTPFLDITSQVANSNDRGLLGVAVHPNFPQTPYVYLLFTWNPPGFSNIAEGGRVSRLIRVEADPSQGYNVALPGSDQPQTTPRGPGHVIVLGTNSTAANIGNPVDGRDPSTASCMTGLTMAGTPIDDCLPSDEDSHSIGTVMFGNDGSLFVGSGDGADYTRVDPRALRAQDLSSLAGKIMRIDPLTGSGLPDNPFYDATCPSCNRSKVYAYGFRNPFRFTVHPVTNEVYVGDVGWNTWEEIDIGKAGNFGWPCYEGGAAGSPPPAESGVTVSLQQGSYATDPSTTAACSALYAQGPGAVRAPIFSYDHADADGTGKNGDASANGGTFYRGTVYPPAYQNAEFILDSDRQWIRYLTFDAQGHATVNDFATENSAGLVQVLNGPDSNLYVVVLNGSGSQVRRIRFVGGGNTPPTAVASATPEIGTAPLVVSFSSVGSFDPDGQALSYTWDFADGTAQSSDQNPTHTYGTSGVYTATLTLTELSTPFATRNTTVLVTVGNEPPLAHITAPIDGSTYKIGDTVTYAGFGTTGGQPIDPSQLTWELRLHHDEHIHVDLLDPGASGTFEVIQHGDDTHYEICLTATVDTAVTDTQCVNIYPTTAPMTFTTDPVGLLINYENEGITQPSPLLAHPVLGSDDTISVRPIQSGLTFSKWNDGVTSNSHDIVIGTHPTTYTAQYVNRPPVSVAVAVPRGGPAPLSVQFTGSGSSDPEFTPLLYSWDFGDGSSSTQADPQHTYTTAGTYKATLTVTDQRDGVAATSATVIASAQGLCGNGQIDPGEACDGGACCTGTCQFAASGTVCRPAAGMCDVAETCSGTSAACPPDASAPDGTACSDGIACTTDVCVSGVCVSTSNCPTGDTCNATTGACDDPPSSYTIWPTNPVPAIVDGGDPASVELGVKFQSDVAGLVTGVRFYKAATNTGTHIGNLWSSGGANLATATFTNETASGWQQVNFTPPVQIAANTIYVASYFAPQGHYSGNLAYFASQGADNAPLHAPANTAVVSGNGVFAYGAATTFPVKTFDAVNYWVDVVFSPQAGPTLTSISISPANPDVPIGGTQQFTATGHYSDATLQDLTNQVVWASLNTAVASVTQSGLSTGMSQGTSTVSASSGTLSDQTTLAVLPPGALAITTTSLPVGLINTPYSATLTASGGTPPLTWTVQSGTLPPGLTLAPSTGVISGTPTTTGVSSFTLQVSGGGQTATRPLSISIAQNAVVAENALPGNPSSEWDITGAGDPSIQGYATDMSVNQGSSISFKVETDSTAYRFDIYRIGYYGGLGARLVATVQPTVTLPQTQPACLSDPTTGLVDCGNWAVSGSWTVPATATSGVYVAKVVREDPEDGRASHILFVVRNDAGTSDLLYQTSDTTWQAYNTYGGNSLYFGSPAGRAYKVSYNRPFTTRCCSFPNGSNLTWFFDAEYPMIRWLERNGYDVSYSSGIDTDRSGSNLLRHKVFMPVGHDEYQSGNERANVEAARAAGVHIAIFSGNHGFWKTRWENSIDGSNTPYRTLVCYKETHANAKIDPLPNVWTGTWRDPRFSPPADGGRPENEVNGSIFMVNGYRNDPMLVPAADGKMRFWRNTVIASLAAGQTATLPAGVLGPEWDVDLDNGFRPAGVVSMSTTTISGVQYLQDYGTNYAPGTATHHLTLYRHPSGALVFGAGTIQWSWGLDATHDFAATPSDPSMQQATVNLFADMGVQPATLMDGLQLATASTDTTPPTATITAPSAGATVINGTQVTVAGTASDSGGQVGAVEVSTDNGTTWHPATGRASWTYVWTPNPLGSQTLLARAVDDSGNIGAPSKAVGVTVAPTTLTAIIVTPANPTVTVGGTQQFTATGMYNDSSTKDLTSQVTWASASASVAVVSTAGLASAETIGTTTISATLGSVTGSTGLTIVGGPLTINTTSLPDALVNQPYTATLTATGGTPPYTWSIAIGTLPAGLSLSPGAGVGVISGTPTTTGTVTFTMQVTSAAGDSVAKAFSIEVDAPSLTIWPSNPTPAIVDGGDPNPVELGVKFRSDVAGNITGIRFYKAATNTGAHVGNLWSSTGTKLGSTTFTAETASGWQEVSFASPVAIQPNTVYVASYFAPNGHYSGDLNYFATTGVDTPPLHALVTGTAGGDGVYGYGATSTFPTNTFKATNYWVDVLFSPQDAPTLTSIAVTPANPTLVVGATQQFTATGTYSDSSTLDLTNQVTFASSTTATATISPAGLATAVAAGTTTISAALGTVSGSTGLTVSAAPLTITTTSLPDASAGTVYTATLAATGGTPPYTWSIASGTLPAGLALTSGTGVISGTPTTMGTSTFTVTVTAGAQQASKTLSIAVDPTLTMIWPSNPIPSIVDGGDPTAVELGVKFRSDVAGFVKGLRFYKSAGNTGTHVGNLWSSSGQNLGSVTFTGETGSGWQQVNFATPVAIQANTVYVASYFAPNGHYSGNLSYFLTQGVDTPPLHALKDGVSGGDGVYAYGATSTFPTNTYQSLNYWVDVIFGTQ
jgi:PKD repeat protein